MSLTTSRQTEGARVTSTQSPTVLKPRLEVVSASSASPAVFEAWARVRDANPIFDSPYFDPEFTKAVSRVRDDVDIATIVCGDEIVAIFPFQRNGQKQLVPVGGKVNDVHAAISSSGAFTKLAQWMNLADVGNSFSFHAALDVQGTDYQFEQVGSYYLNMSNGWEAYRKWVFNHSSTIARQGQKTRGLARDHGPLRFEFDICESDMLERLIELKRGRYQRARTFDILSVDWAANLLREIHKIREPNFRGILSGLFAGDKLVAIHFGMMTKNILHYWFPVYDPAYSKYSPGTEMLLRVAETAAEQGITKLDLGYGDDAYKFKFANGTESLCCGRITESRLGFHVARKRYEIRKQLKKIPLKPLVKVMLRSVFPGFGGWNYR